MLEKMWRAERERKSSWALTEPGLHPTTLGPQHREGGHWEPHQNSTGIREEVGPVPVPPPTSPPTLCSSTSPSHSARGSHSAFHLTVSNEGQASGEENIFHKLDECWCVDMATFIWNLHRGRPWSQVGKLQAAEAWVRILPKSWLAWGQSPGLPGLPSLSVQWGPFTISEKAIRKGSALSTGPTTQQLLN